MYSLRVHSGIFFFDDIVHINVKDIKNNINPQNFEQQKSPHIKKRSNCLITYTHTYICFMYTDTNFFKPFFCWVLGLKKKRFWKRLQ